MEVRWSDNAIRMADEVLDYTFDMFGEKQAKKISEPFVSVTEQLELMPFSGQVEAALNGLPHVYRYLLINPELKLLYYVENEVVNVAAIWNVRQNEYTIAVKMAHECVSS